MLFLAQVDVTKASAHVPVVAAVDEPEWLTFTATAYTADCDGCTGITAAGIDVRHTQVDESGRRIIATDTDVIPLGTTLEIRIDDRVIQAVAADRGSAIDGREIDVLMATEGEALEFGRRDVQIRIVSEENE